MTGEDPGSTAKARSKQGEREVVWPRCAYCGTDYPKKPDEINMYCGSCRLASHHKLEQEVKKYRRLAANQLAESPKVEAELAICVDAQSAGNAVGSLGPPHTVVTAEGALLLSWTVGRRRVSVNFEKDPAESSWHLVDFDSNTPATVGPLTGLAQALQRLLGESTS